MATTVRGMSPVVESSWQKRYSSRIAKQAVFTSFVTITLGLLLYLDMTYENLSAFLDISHPIVWFIELILLILVVCRLFQDLISLIHYLKVNVFGKVVELSEQQKKLLGVRENEKGFGSSPVKPSPSPSSSPRLLFSSQSHCSTMTPGDSPEHHSASNISNYSPHIHHSSRMSLSSYSTPSSFDRHYHSLNVSGGNPSLSGIQLDWSEHSSLRSRHSGVASATISPVPSRERITDMNSLVGFLRDQEEKELRIQQASPDNLSGASPSFWSYGSSPMDCSHILKKYQYQVSTRSPQSPTAKSSHSDQSLTAGREEIWNNLGVSEDTLYHWIECIRKWISFTIVVRLTKEIEEINKTLVRLGCEDTQIGEVNVSTLKQLAMTKGSLISNLNAIIPYLDFTSNQEYIAKRIKDLGTGCMSEFDWNGGGHYGKPWAEYLPTDASLVMHFLCTYFDSRLPAHPKYPDGKTFTNQYFMKSPDKPKLERHEGYLLYQSSINPPHYQVIVKGEVYNLPKGHSNMFQAILLFLYHIKTKEAGMLGRVSLGRSGLNLMWIFD